MATPRQPRLRPVEKELARRLAAVYRVTPTTEAEMAAWNAHAENAEQDLPWKRDFDRAVYVQDVAMRYAWLQEARRG